MATGRTVASALIAMAVVAVLIGPLATSVGSSTGTVGVNETISAQQDEWQDIEGYDLTANFTATNTNGGTTLSEGSDYELATENGSIQFLSGSANVAQGDDVRLVYDYQGTDTTTSTIANLIPLFAALLLIGVAAARIQQMMRV